jgi:hypothetical protein
MKNSHLLSQIYQTVQMWKHPEHLYGEQEGCYEVVGGWVEEYQLQREDEK